MILTVHFLGANIPLQFTVGEFSTLVVEHIVSSGKSGSFQDADGNRIFINTDHVLYMQHS